MFGLFRSEKAVEANGDYAAESLDASESLPENSGSGVIEEMPQKVFDIGNREIQAGDYAAPYQATPYHGLVFEIQAVSPPYAIGRLVGERDLVVQFDIGIVPLVKVSDDYAAAQGEAIASQRQSASSLVRAFDEFAKSLFDEIVVNRDEIAEAKETEQLAVEPKPVSKKTPKRRCSAKR